MAFDPAIAADGYLSQIPAAVRALAIARTNAAEWRLAVGWLGEGFALLVLLKSRAILRIERWARSASSRLWVATAVTVAAFAMAWAVVRPLISAGTAAIWPADHPLTVWDALSATPLHAALNAAGLGIVLAAAKAWPKRWWAWLGGGVAALIAIVVLVTPVTLPQLGRNDRIAPPSAHAASILAFARRGGLDAGALYVFDAADPADVDAESLGPFKHLAVSAAALAAPRPETLAALGHLLGHDRHRDLWSMTLLYAVMAVLGFAAIARLTGPLACSLGEPALGGPGDPAALPALALVVWACALPAGVAFDAFDRAINYRADAYALSLTGDAGGLAHWLITAEANSKADPSPLETILFYDHPPLRPRLIADLRLKPVHAAP